MERDVEARRCDRGGRHDSESCRQPGYRHSERPVRSDIAIENGAIKDCQITFDASAEEHGRDKRIHFFGQVTDDVITLHNQSNGKQGLTMTFHRTRD
jgi:hypothetical protein